jgi:hypothetical protein
MRADFARGNDVATSPLIGTGFTTRKECLMGLNGKKAFSAKIIEEVKEGRHVGRSAA